VAALQDGFYALSDEGQPELIAPVEADDPRTRFNDGEIDPQGRFWAGTMDWHAEPELGSLYRLDPDGRVTRMVERVTISNGLGWSPDGGTMYYVDTTRPPGASTASTSMRSAATSATAASS